MEPTSTTPEADRPATDPADYPVAVRIPAVTEDRNRLTAAFRFFLALPHLILVGGPVAVITTFDWSSDSGAEFSYGSGGLVGAVVWLAVVIGWFAIVITARHPDWIRRVSTWYLRWRLQAIAYMTLLRDEYPPFGEGAYPVDLVVPPADPPRNRLTVAFRLVLALPHLLVLWILNLVWAFTTALAWAAILLTGRYPKTLYGYALGVLAWTIRVEAYVLLLRDEYPPFTLRA